jgi:hypothetical protein
MAAEYFPALGVESVLAAGDGAGVVNEACAGVRLEQRADDGARLSGGFVYADADGFSGDGGQPVNGFGDQPSLRPGYAGLGG